MWTQIVGFLQGKGTEKSTETEGRDSDTRLEAPETKNPAPYSIFSDRQRDTDFILSNYTNPEG